MDQDVAFLPNAEGAVGRLVFDHWVPPAVKVDDMRSRRQVQARAARFEREDEERRPGVFLEGIDQRFALGDRSVATERQSGSAEDLGQ